ncbi:MAG: YaiO family outer membrane beta-barrel protein [Alphaproteobacteria bacterium]|nr:MAG: YaiO family outer membrane beta-barrel protein [Alphaproteobacteria bacterium]
MKLCRALWLSALAFSVPAEAQTDYEAGAAARQAGRLDEALQALHRAADAKPDDADVQLQLGLTYLAVGRLDEAEAAFKRTLALAPDYGDAKLGLARVALRRGDIATARAELGGVAPGHAEVEPLRRQIEAAAAAAPWRWRIDLDGSYSRVDGAADWQSSTLTVQHRPGTDTTIGLTADATRRFERTDVYLEARVDHRFAPGSYVHVLVGGTPGADHRPTGQVGAGAAIRTHKGDYATILRLDVLHADYPTGDVQIVTPGVEQYFGGRAWITAQWINVWGRFRHGSGWLLRGDIMPTDRFRLFLGAADAPDLDSGTAIYTKSLFGGVSLDVGDHLTMRLSAAHDDPRESGNRNTLALGLGYRF